MTEAINGVQLEEALAVIDRGLSEMMRRDLVATAEVADLLLDLRSVLTFVPEPAIEPASELGDAQIARLRDVFATRPSGFGGRSPPERTRRVAEPPTRAHR